MKSFFKDFLIYGFASVLAKIAGIFLMPVYTSILTREEYGVMTMLLSLNGVLGLLANLNVHSGIARDYYEEGIDRKSLISTGFWSIAALSLSIMTIMICSRGFWLHDVLSVPGHNVSFLLVLFTIPTGSLSSYFAILTRFKTKPILFSIGSLIQLTIQIPISVFGVVVLGWGIFGILLGMLCGEVFAFIYYLLLNWELIALKFNWVYLKQAFLFSIPTLPAILAGWADSSIGQILIGRTVSLSDLGVYSIALSFVSIITLISTALQNVWGPFLYENYKKPDFKKEADRLFSTFVLILILVACSVSLMSKELVLLFSNPSYLDARQYLTLLLISQGVYMLFPFASSGVNINRKTYFTAIAYITGSVVNVLFIIVFIKTMGIYAVLLGLALSRMTSFLLQYHYSKSFIRLSLYKIFVYILLLAGCFVVVWFDLSLYIRIILLVFLFGIMSYLCLTRYNILILKRLIVKR